MKKLFFALGLTLASVTLLPSQVSNVPLNQTPSRIVGHPQPEQFSVPSGVSPNLVEGREMWNPSGVALDTSASPPIVYVSDTLNNRVMAWKNATGFTNGQPADLIIGQPDAYHTTAQGPGHTFQTGLNFPTGLTVFKGDLYVADTGNNRVLRFPKPFANIGSEFPDLYIGQPNLNSATPNETGSIAASGLALQSGGSVYRVGLAFDSHGNLWMSDPGNARVLEFAAADLAKGGGPLAAQVEIGQLDFSSKQPALKTGTAANYYITNQFFTSSAVAFDPKGRLFVGDIGRVLVFQPPFQNNMGATRIMGLATPPTNQFNSQTQLQATAMSDPEAIFFIPGGLNTGGVGVVDAGWSRILLFDSYENWPDPSATFSPQARSVVGQVDFHAPACPNGGTPASNACTSTPPASATLLNAPGGVAYSGTELYIADSGNNRAIVMPLTSALTTTPPATRVLGQDNFIMQAPNLIEGREFDFYNPTAGGGDAGIAVDTTSNTPHLYVADPYNNRILGFKDLRKVKPGARADIVIGEPDFSSGLCNVTGDPNSPQSYSLCLPTSVVVDSNGNLYVADHGNGRVLRFPVPFSHQGALEQADLVLGQHDFTSKITDPSSSTMAAPYGLTLIGTNGLAVSDTVHNRVLFFPLTNNAFTNGEAASKVFGQPDFITITPGSANSQMNAPHHLSSDTDGRLYVADSANNRVLIFDQINNDPATGAQAAAQVTGLASPRGVYVNPVTGEFWVTNTNSGTAVKYPRYDDFVLNPASTVTIPAASNTLAVTQDQYGDLVVADLTSRIAIYFPTLVAINGGNFLVNPQTGQPQPLTPGLLTTIVAADSDCTQGNCQGGSPQFGTATAAYTDLPNPLPLPTTLGDIQVLFNGTPAPLYYVSPTQINFLVPMYDSSGNPMPTSGTAEVLVVQASTGQIYGAGQAQMATAAPAILMLTYSGPIRQAAVINQDGSINDSTHPAARGSVISIYATGEGFVPGAPADGNVPQSLLSTPATPRVAIGSAFVDTVPIMQGDPQDGQFVQFSGLSPQFPGIWQINVQIPMATPPSQQTFIGILMNSVNSLNPAVYRTIINVGQ